jgi:hypothetical protein
MQKKSPYTNPQFLKYRTFPDGVDAELDRLKLEHWLCLLMDGTNPVEWMQENGIKEV